MFSIKIILECYYVYYKAFSGPEWNKLQKFVLPLMIKFHKTMDLIDKNLVWDLNEMIKRIATYSTIRQLKRLGAMVYENTEAIPTKHYKRYQDELKNLRDLQQEFDSEKFYVE